MGIADDFTAIMLTCEDRTATRAATLQSLSDARWPSSPEIIIDDGIGETRLNRIHRTWRRVIQRAAQASTPCVLLLEDDVVFGKWFTHNLATWPVVRTIPPGGAVFASLYNPSHPTIARRPQERYAVAHPHSVWGAQALVMTPSMARYIDTHWDTAEGNPDQRMPRLASRLAPILLHLPSLVDHAATSTTWGGRKHSARDFDPEWCASDSATRVARRAWKPDATRPPAAKLPPTL